MITFRYNDRIYKVQHLANKLKKLKITEQDIEILPNENELERQKKIDSLPTESWHNPRLYYYLNPNTGYSITSIYPNINVDGYEQVSKETLERLWNKTE